MARGAEIVSRYGDGAYTGDVSDAAEFGCRYVIVGHSERRALFGEFDADGGVRIPLAARPEQTLIVVSAIAGSVSKVMRSLL